MVKESLTTIVDVAITSVSLITDVLVGFVPVTDSIYSRYLAYVRPDTLEVRTPTCSISAAALSSSRVASAASKSA